MSIVQETHNGDPSGIKQAFPKFNLELHCCRLWWLKNWEHRALAFPFWRIYYNCQAGASIFYKEQRIPLQPHTFYLISPNTVFASQLYDQEIPAEGFVLNGGSVVQMKAPEKALLAQGKAIEHLFIHFTIGFPYDTIMPALYSFPVDSHFQKQLDILVSYFSQRVQEIDLHIYLTLQALVCELLSKIDNYHWEQLTNDKRISRVIKYIESNLSAELSNQQLANIACMATNSFAHLFKKELRISLHQYVNAKRINAACLLLIHTDNSIEEIAEKTGFSDRYHFSRIFREVSCTTPAKYRKKYKLIQHF
ncbi:MAG: AraC family transcriptional regulator [Prevotella sp.]|nr:AraC family transcriptional regulator [Massilibacteroides sp.]